MENAINFIEKNALIKDINKRICAQDDDMSFRVKLYCAEVSLVKELIVAMTGFNRDMDDDLFHDFACSLVDEIHENFDK